MGIFDNTKAKKMEMERNSLYFFWKKEYTLLEDISVWYEITRELSKMNTDNFFVDIQGNKSRAFIMSKEDTLDLLVSALQYYLYKAEKNGEYVIFGAINNAYISVTSPNSSFSKLVEKQRLEYQKEITKKLIDFENDTELKECLGCKPIRYHFGD